MADSYSLLAPMNRSRRALLALVAIGISAGVGCGDRRPQLVPVSGQVTLDGGSWPVAGSLYFIPVEAAEGFPRRPGSADFGTDGRFAAKTFHAGDGLFPGKYRVRAECWESPPAMNFPGKSHIPAKYLNPTTSGMEVAVKPGDVSIQSNFNVTKQ